MKIQCKIVLIGEGTVGKTSLRRNYMGKTFEKKYIMTFGADFSTTALEYGDDVMLVNIWDLAGQESYKAVREVYYRGSTGAMLVYDITNRKSFEALDNWIEELHDKNEAIIPIMLIGNKIDLIDSGADYVSKEEAIQYAESISKKFNIAVELAETSALTGENVKETFRNFITHLHKKAIQSRK